MRQIALVLGALLIAGAAMSQEPEPLPESVVVTLTQAEAQTLVAILEQANLTEVVEGDEALTLAQVAKRIFLRGLSTESRRLVRTLARQMSPEVVLEKVRVRVAEVEAER